MNIFTDPESIPGCSPGPRSKLLERDVLGRCGRAGGVSCTRTKSSDGCFMLFLFGENTEGGVLIDVCDP